MSEVCYIGIDTSNYTTSVALVTAAGEVLANLKAPLAVREGERGLRQSDAVFAHVKNLPGLMDALRGFLKDRTPCAVGVSARPRDAEGSYMPCFLAGVSAAHAFAAGGNVPVFEFSHQKGHVMAALYSSGAQLLGTPFGAFHVSGGTTEMLYVTPCGNDFSVELVGSTADLNAGQAVDRIGVALGLRFPCGPALEKLAKENQKPVPRPRISVQDGQCHFSGLENLALRLFRESGDAALTAAFVLRFISETLAAMANTLRGEHPGLPLLFAGGVMSNRIIAEDLRTKLGNDVHFAEPAFSADNAAGVALLCCAASQNNEND